MGVSYIWIDLETTGLTPGKDRILEIGLVATTPATFEIVDEESILIEYPDLERWIANSLARAADLEYDRNDLTMHARVLEMHEQSGLFDALLDGHGVQIDVAACKAKSFFDRNGGAGRLNGKNFKSPMCGSTVDFDRGFLVAEPAFAEFVRCFSYRRLDVSALKEIIKGRYGDEFRTVKSPAHRGVSDLHHSVQELCYYLDRYFPPIEERESA